MEYTGELPYFTTKQIVRVELQFPVVRTRDPHNYTFPTVKAIVDGLVKAGLFKDDSDEYLACTDPTLTVSHNNTVTIHIHEAP